MEAASTTPLGHDAQYKRTLGIGSITLMVIAMAAPIAVVAGTVPLVVSTTGTIGAPVYYLAAGLILCVFAVGFTAMSKFVPNAGAFYSYIQAGLGRVLGMGSATMALVSYSILLVAVLAYFGALAANVVVTFTGADVPWWLFTLAAWAAIAFLGYRNVDLSSKVLGIFLVAEAASIAVLDGSIIAAGGADGLNAAPFDPANFTAGAPGIGLMFAFFGFIGFESTAVFRNEAKDPDKTIPRATFLSVGIISVLYVISSWCIVMGGGSDVIALSAASPDTMAADLATVYVSYILHDVIQILLVTSLFACALCAHNIIARYQYTLANVGVLPRRLATVHSEHSAPSFSSIVTTITSFILLAAVTIMALDPVTQIYAWFSGGATLGIMLLELLTSVSIIVFFQKNRKTASGFSAWQRVIAPALATVGMAVVTALVITNFPFLIGDFASAAAMGALAPASFAIGCIMAARLKKTAPDTYRSLNSLVVSPA